MKCGSDQESSSRNWHHVARRPPRHPLTLLTAGSRGAPKTKVRASCLWVEEERNGAHVSAAVLRARPYYNSAEGLATGADHKPPRRRCVSPSWPRSWPLAPALPLPRGMPRPPRAGRSMETPTDTPSSFLGTTGTSSTSRFQTTSA